LNAALKTTSDTRPDAVARGLALVSDANYPSDAEVKVLSGFLASRLQTNQD
jgi:hypothetical protein